MKIEGSAQAIREALKCGRSGCGCKRQKGNVHCPSHDVNRLDKTPSLSLRDGTSGIPLWKCFNGCSQPEVTEAIKNLELLPTRMASAGSSNGQHSDKVTYSPESSSRGLAIAELAKAKGIQINDLEEWGVSSILQNNASRVVIPYAGPEGDTMAIRYRESLTGSQRFKWRKGDHVALYGLKKLDAIRKAGWVMLVEGETDTWTGWLHDVPSLGIPGKSTWQSAWAEFVNGIDVYLWCEPDAEDLIQRVSMDIPGLKVLQAPNGIKDINEAHVLGMDVSALIKGMMPHAVTASQAIREAADRKSQELRLKAATILESTDPLEMVEQAIRALGYGGDISKPLITYIAMTSRVLRFRPGGMPVHLLLLGPASAGKSYTVGTVLRLFPEGAYIVIDAGSPRILIYGNQDLRHRIVVFGEADSLPSGEDNSAASAIRNLMQDGSLRYDVTIRDKETGEYTVREIREEGPTELVTTAVRPLGNQLMSRLFTLDITGDNDQIRAALKAQALAEVGVVTEVDGALVAFQEYLQVYAPWDVVVPFVEPLTNAIAQRSNAPLLSGGGGS